MPRTVPEWIGRNDDSMPPPNVRLRIFKAYGGICCIAKRKIQAGEPWDLHHVIPLWKGGENRESNLAPALRDKHRKVSAEESAGRAEERRKQKAHHGIKSKSRFPNSRDGKWKTRLDGTTVPR